MWKNPELLQGAVAVSGVLWYARDRENAAYPAKRFTTGGDTMISERIEDGTRILTAETEEDFAQALDMQGPHDEIEAPVEVLEAFGIQSAESLGIEPDDLGLPAEAYERGRWN